MTDSDKPNATPADAFREAAERARELAEQMMQNAQKAVEQPLPQPGQEVLRRYVEWLHNAAEEESKFASSSDVSKVEGLAAMLTAQADFTREFANSLSRFTGEQEASGSQSASAG